MRVKLVVAYDGTEYCGWQVQPNAVTVEGVLTEHLRNLLKEPVELIGASRTDSGVHAMGNVAVFDTQTRIPAEKLSYALNARLPEDIVIQSSKEVDADFHPRYCNCTKTYEYKIQNASFCNPMLRKYSLFYHYPLDIDKMREASKFIMGTHDFTSFCSAGAQVKEKVRTIYSLDVTKNEDLITLRITGNGFLYNMVRIITGTLIKVGEGKIQPQDMPQIIEGMDRQLAGPTAPPQGLTLVSIKYDE